MSSILSVFCLINGLIIIIIIVIIIIIMIIIMYTFYVILKCALQHCLGDFARLLMQFTVNGM